MNREAFEAWLNPGKHAGNISPWVEPGRYKKVTDQVAWMAWQAAIAHARNVAVRVCEETSYEAPRHEREYYYNEACKDCADAIKEALK